MTRASTRALLPLFALLACDAPARLTPEQLAPKPEALAAPAPTPEPARVASTPADGKPDPNLPVVGDPLGLLSRPQPRADAPGAQAPAPQPRFDPGALMAAARATPTLVQERDPRAVARGTQAMVEQPRRTSSAPSAGVPVQEKSAAELIGSIKRSSARPHVLFLYAAYCGACREVLPNFLPLVEHYGKSVSFTAASIDRDRDAYERYAPVLRGVLPPVLIRSEGMTRQELVRAGLSFDGDGFSIPLLAVFDKGHRLVRQGGGRELARLARTLDELSQ